jgi:IS5 family transposase
LGLRGYLRKIHKNENHKLGGPTGYDPLKMFKAVFLGQWHNLSDPGLEERLRVRLDFMAFTGFEMGSAIPDETTLCRFRNKLIALKLDKKLFGMLNQELEKLGLQIESAEGALVDARIIESNCRPRNRPLKPWENGFNRLVSHHRFRVEQAFGTLKRRFHLNRFRYISLQNVQSELIFKSMGFNLLKAANSMA